MNTLTAPLLRRRLTAAAALAVAATAAATASFDELEVSPTSAFAWSENLGWINFAPTLTVTPSGPATGPLALRADHLVGFVWSENAGWINFGAGGPYANTTGADFGVNIQPDGTLTGYAWGENIGWINFGPLPGIDAASRARIDQAGLRFRGYAWGENVGWINLDDPGAFVGLVASCPADLAPAGAPNGVVDVNDAIFILNRLGACPVAPAPCPADLAPDGAPNGTVDVNDVIFVLNRLGACP